MRLDGDFVLGIETLLRAELAQEVEAAFPKLSRIPSAGIIKFLDYFAALAPAERSALIDALARVGALQFFPSPLIAKAHEHLRITDAAYLRFREAMQSPEFAHGLRYSGLRMSRAMLSDPESMVHMARTRSTLDFQPRDDPPKQLVLDPDFRHVQTAKAPLLRKLLNQALSRRLSAKGAKQPGGDIVYQGAIGSIPLKVWISFSNLYAQMYYGVTFALPERNILAQRLTYETLWGMNTGWDYLTEKNAERSIELLDQLLISLAQLLERIVALPAPA